MPGAKREVVVAISSEDKGAGRGLKQLGDDVDKLGNRLKAAGKAGSSGLGEIGSAATGLGPKLTGVGDNIRGVGDRARESDERLRGASRGVEKYGTGLDNVGNRADEVDTRMMGLSDGITGATELMRSGELSSAEMAMAFADLGSSMYNTVIPSLKDTVDGLKGLRGNMKGIAMAGGAAAAIVGVGAAIYQLGEAQSAARIDQLHTEFMATRDAANTLQATLSDSLFTFSIWGGSLDELTGAMERALDAGPEVAQQWYDSAIAAGMSREQLAGFKNQIDLLNEAEEQAAMDAGIFRASVEAIGNSARAYGVDAARAALNVGDMVSVDHSVSAMNLAGSLTTLVSTTADATEKTAAYSSALDALFGGALSEREAVIAVQESIDSLTESIVTNGQNLDINTAQGRANQSAFNASAQAAIDHAAAVYEETGSLQTATSTLTGHIDQLRAEAIEAGLTEDQVNVLTDAINLTPERIQTLFDAHTEAANRRTDALQNNVWATPNAWTSMFHADTYGANRDVDDLQANINNTVGRTVSLQVNTFFSGVNPFRRALGGPVSPDEVYLVGEQGPELFIPHKDGTIVPNGETMAALSGDPGYGPGGMLAGVGQATATAPPAPTSSGGTVIVNNSFAGAIIASQAEADRWVAEAFNRAAASGKVNVRGRRV